MTDRAYWRRATLTAWLMAGTVLVSLMISVFVGWQANSPRERIRDTVIAVLSGAVAYLTVRWCAGVGRRFAHRYLMTDDKAAALVEEALDKGLLPRDYVRSRARDRRIAKTIRSGNLAGHRRSSPKHPLDLLLLPRR